MRDPEPRTKNQEPRTRQRSFAAEVLCFLFMCPVYSDILWPGFMVRQRKFMAQCALKPQVGRGMDTEQ